MKNLFNESTVEFINIWRFNEDKVVRGQLIKKVSINEESYRFDKISNMNEHDCSFINTLSIIGYYYNYIPEVYINDKDWWKR